MVSYANVAEQYGIGLTSSIGPKEDFGIKYNLSNGAPAPEKVTNTMHEIASAITEYKIADLPDVNCSVVLGTSVADVLVDRPHYHRNQNLRQSRG